MAENAHRSVLDLFNLKGRRALVTGGSKGLGFVFAQALAEAGADVVVVSRTEAECAQAAQQIASGTGQRVVALTADVSIVSEVERVRKTAESQLGAIDILVNNAGINRRGNISDLTAEDFEAVMQTNVTALFHTSKAFGVPMAERGWGRIINLGSIMSVISLPQRVPYATSKSAVIGMTKTLALEWASQGVTVNAICPGPFATEMNRQLLNDPVKYKDFVSRIPMGRWGELHEIVGALVFLASDAASFVTGSCLFVDGGWTAQ